MDAQIIPADTDYRMFSYKYYGSLPGVDIAFLLDSSAYHTHNDSPERIRPGTVQVSCLLLCCWQPPIPFCICALPLCWMLMFPPSTYTIPLAHMKGAATAWHQPTTPSHCCVVTVSTFIFACVFENLHIAVVLQPLLHRHG